MSERVERVAADLTERHLRLVVAESCTGGLLAERLTRRPGASRFLLAGLVTYADEAKVRVLGVRPETLAAYGAVSEPVATEMAAGARSALDADAAVAITGIAGPDGGTPQKPVGTVWIAAELGERRRVESFRFTGDRDQVRDQAVEHALALLADMLGGAA